MLAWRREQRAALIAARMALPMAEHHAASRQISEQLIHLLSTLRPRVLGAYWPFRREFSPLPLMRARQVANLSVALPVVVSNNEPLEFRQWTEGAPMATGVYDIPYPADRILLIPDTLLIPMLGFDAAGYRLGYGGGYYDRTIAAASPRPHLIGISFELARIPSIRPLSHDIPMDWVITEQATYPRPA